MLFALAFFYRRRSARWTHEILVGSTTLQQRVAGSSTAGDHARYTHVSVTCNMAERLII